MDSPACDVAIVGAGIAGLAAAILLRREGLSVVCLDARPHPHEKVGESLDWSSPALLRSIGVDVGDLARDGAATLKRKIAVCEDGRESWEATPPPVIRRRPMRFETVTYHVDRTALDLRAYERAQALGVTFIWERVRGVETGRDRITGLSTHAGRRLTARWYVDASGTGRLFARALDIPVTTYGRRKVCLWAYFDTPPLGEGTTFFVDNRDAYLRWVWDIPITPARTSIGYVLPADDVRRRRREGHALAAIFGDELRRHARFSPLLAAQGVPAVSSVSFQPFVVSRVCGPNWLLVGEAASMPDPLTGNGVTSGIRHARHATDAIRAGRATGEIPPRRQRVYGRHVFRLGRSFNAHIERAVYRAPLRQALGLQTATYVYTGFAFFTNALHARFDPRGPAGMAAFALIFAAAWTWIGAWVLMARAVLRLRPARTAGRAAAPASPGDSGSGRQLPRSGSSG